MYELKSIMRSAPAVTSRGRRGFTIVEMLIVVAIIILLVSLVTVAIRAARQTSQTANTRSLMSAISQAMVQFEQDHDYLPPVLDSARAVLQPPNPDVSGSYPQDIQDWFSATTPADYLLGYGQRAQDGYGCIDCDNDGTDDFTESPFTGIRSPGIDGAWGSTIFNAQSGTLDNRQPTIRGKVFGPYLQTSDERLIGVTDGTTNSITGNLNVYFEGEPNYDPDLPRVICDYWGSPIYFHRLPYHENQPGSRFSRGDRNGDGVLDEHMPSLADVYALRPFETESGAEVTTVFADGNGDTIATRSLNAARIGLLSPGPDRTLDRTVRRDSPDDFNADNIVELSQ